MSPLQTFLFPPNWCTHICWSDAGVQLAFPSDSWACCFMLLWLVKMFSAMLLTVYLSVCMSGCMHVHLSVGCAQCADISMTVNSKEAYKMVMGMFHSDMPSDDSHSRHENVDFEQQFALDDGQLSYAMVTWSNAFDSKPISMLRSVICHMEWLRHRCMYSTLTPARQAVLDFPTPEGWKAELVFCSKLRRAVYVLFS